MRAIVLLFITSCSRDRIHAEPDAALISTPAAVDAGALACAIVADPESLNHEAAADRCLGDSRRTCWKGCESDCVTCGAKCAHDAACEAKCLRERDACQTVHCADVHRACRDDLVGRWLADHCDATCGAYDDCRKGCVVLPRSGYDACNAKCDAMGTASCGIFMCDQLLNAVERKTLDPRWKAHDCDKVCKDVWTCAENECNRSGSCGEPIKKRDACVAKVPNARACGLDHAPLLCPEP